MKNLFITLLFVTYCNLYVSAQTSEPNPNNTNAVVNLNWLNDVARIRVGGSGVGADNGFDIQGPTNVSYMRFLHNGFVGVGTKTPQAKMDIVTGGGHIHAGRNNKSSLSLLAFSGSFFHLHNTNNVGGTSALQFSHGNDVGEAPIMTLKNDGKVGIGTVDPQNKLSVLGTIWAEKIKVSLTDAADWVFEEDYELRSLEEVKAHITKYKHLPDMPSADEFRQNDMDVADMNNKLLQKIEELTLYLIDQNDRIKKLETENLELKQLISK